MHAYMISTSFVMLVNGGASFFFRATRGLRLGDPLLPFIVHCGYENSQ